MFLKHIVSFVLFCVFLVSSAPYTDRSPVTSIKDELLGQEDIWAESSTYITIGQNSPTSREFFVTLSKKQMLKDEQGNSVAQSGSMINYRYSPMADPDAGLLFKLHPVEKTEMVMFGYIIPSLTSDLSQGAESVLLHHYEDQDDQYQWFGDAPALTLKDAVLDLFMEVFADGVRVVRVQATVDGKQLEQVTFRLPPVAVESNKDGEEEDSDHAIAKAQKTAGSPTMSSSHPHYSDKVFSLEDYIQSYYGVKVSSYTKIRAIKDSLQALFVGFVSPFLCLGIVFVIIAAGIYMCNGRPTQGGIQLTDEDVEEGMAKDVTKDVTEDDTDSFVSIQDPEKKMLAMV